MTKLRTILAGNIKTYRNEIDSSQLKLTGLVGTAPQLYSHDRDGKIFPADTMLEKIASALQREPFELFSIAPVQKQWQTALWIESADFTGGKFKEVQRTASRKP
ncbi:MAG: hypothetical protein LBQ14_08195 [Treponema sp.]|jgi:transcriptional regulator with XRE-family HTH domain|nr:hypothetical protein [Treponema sp.]